MTVDRGNWVDGAFFVVDAQSPAERNMETNLEENMCVLTG